MLENHSCDQLSINTILSADYFSIDQEMPIHDVAPGDWQTLLVSLTSPHSKPLTETQQLIHGLEPIVSPINQVIQVFCAYLNSREPVFDAFDHTGLFAWHRLGCWMTLQNQVEISRAIIPDYLCAFGFDSLDKTSLLNLIRFHCIRLSPIRFSAQFDGFCRLGLRLRWLIDYPYIIHAATHLPLIKFNPLEAALPLELNFSKENVIRAMAFSHCLDYKSSDFELLVNTWSCNKALRTWFLLRKKINKFPDPIYFNIAQMLTNKRLTYRQLKNLYRASLKKHTYSIPNLAPQCYDYPTSLIHNIKTDPNNLDFQCALLNWLSNRLAGLTNQECLAISLPEITPPQEQLCLMIDRLCAGVFSDASLDAYTRRYYLERVIQALEVKPDIHQVQFSKTCQAYGFDSIMKRDCLIAKIS